MNDELVKAMKELEETKVLEIVQAEMDKKGDAMAVLTACQEGMAEVGKLYEAGEYFVSDLMMAGEIFKEVRNILAPALSAGGGESKGKVVFGTVKGDIHDIGKDLVVGLLKSTGYDVTDLGVDVPVQDFVKAVKETGATVLGLSGLLTIAFDAMKETIAALQDAGLRSGVKVMIGGGPVNDQVKDYTGADAWGKDPQAAINLCKEWIR